MTRIFSTTTALLLAFTPAPADDWPMLGGRPDRNMVSAEKGLPLAWDGKTKFKWVADLGTNNYSTPAVAGGKVFVGTNNEAPRDPAVKGDKGILMCFSEKDGTFLWQAVHDKLPAGDAVDYRLIGVSSSPCVVGDRVYYVSNRGELVCADVEGFADGENDGPVKDEARTGKKDADFVWALDLPKELGVTPNQSSASSPLVVGELLFVVTGQGADYKDKKVKNAAAPSFIAVNRTTGKVVWKHNSPGDRILWGQWGSPGYGVVDGKPQVAFPGGDGWLYAFEPETGKPLWRFNCKAHEKPPGADGKPETENQLVAAPVYAGHRVLIAVGDPESGFEEGALRAIDARKAGDVTASAELWRLGGKDFSNSISSVTVHEGLVYAVNREGYMSCVDLETGKRVWLHDFLAEVWGSPVVAEGRVYLQTGDGAVLVLQAGREKKVLATNKGINDLGHGTPVPANGVLYLTGGKKLYAVGSAK